jgi:hypothetical protein
MNEGSLLELGQDRLGFSHSFAKALFDNKPVYRRRDKRGFSEFKQQARVGTEAHPPIQYGSLVFAEEAHGCAAISNQRRSA